VPLRRQLWSVTSKFTFSRTFQRVAAVVKIRGEWKSQSRAISDATHRSVGTFLTGVLPGASFEINVNSMDDVEEVLHDRHFLVHSARWNRTLGTI